MCRFLASAGSGVVVLFACLLAPDPPWAQLLSPTFPVHKSGAVFITGCSSGIGFDAALTLLSEGYDVFATVRKQKDMDVLAAAAPEGSRARLHPIICDVVNRSQLMAAVADVQAWLTAAPIGRATLVGVVNNAGVASEFMPMEHVAPETLEWVLDVNLRAPITVCQAFLPLLRAHGPGRIVNVGSLAGQMARQFRGPYTISKFGLEGLSDTLRMELKLEHISVSMVNPGYVKSEIGPKTLHMNEAATSTTLSKISDLQRRMLGPFEESYKKATQAAPLAHETSTDILHALQAPKPSTRYYPGSCGIGTLSAGLCQRFLWLLPDRVKDAAMVKAAPDST